MQKLGPVLLSYAAGNLTYNTALNMKISKL